MDNATASVPRGRFSFAEPKVVWATVALALFLLFSGFVFGLDTFGRPFSSESYSDLESLAIAMLVSNWLLAYRHRFGGPHFLDEGLFCLVFGLLMAPVYLVASRGRAAFALGMGFVAALVACGAVGALLALGVVAVLL